MFSFVDTSKNGRKPNFLMREFASSKVKNAS